MSIHLLVTIGCESCEVKLSIQSSSAGTNASSVRQMAEGYGWSVTKGKERCLDHRTRPIAFHAFSGPSSSFNWQECETCGTYDKPVNPTKPAHREMAVKVNAGELRRLGHIVYR